MNLLMKEKDTHCAQLVCARKTRALRAREICVCESEREREMFKRVTL